MKEYTFKDFLNGEFSILVNSENIEHALNCLSKTKLKWRNGEIPNEFNPFVEVKDLNVKYICLYVCCRSLFFSRHIDNKCPLIGFAHLIIEDDDLEINDFIGQCVKSDNEQLYTVGKLYYFKNGKTINNKKKSSYLYDSIENFNKRNKIGFKMVEIKEVNRKAEVGEYVKVVRTYEIPKTNGTLDYDKGSILKIIKIDEDGNCHYSDRYYGYLYDEEYVVLDGYQDLKEDKIEVGDMVTVTNNGECYDIYEEWFDYSNNEKLKSHFVKLKSPVTGKDYKVVGVGKHFGSKRGLVYCIQDLDTTQVFLMCKDGIKKVSDERQYEKIVKIQ